MTTLPERLQDVIVSFRRLAKDHEIKADRPHQDDSTRQWHMGTAEAYDDAADRLEAAQPLQAAPEGGEAVGYTAQHSIDLIARGGADGVTFGTYSERYERTVPLYIAPRHPADEGRADALRIAEAALADIGDADREPGDDVAWCERRAAQALPAVRAAIKAGTP